MVRSSAHAAPEGASHASKQSNGLREINKATGAATQTIKAVHQSAHGPATQPGPEPRKKISSSILLRK
jgi:hypothetical protein